MDFKYPPNMKALVDGLPLREQVLLNGTLSTLATNLIYVSVESDLANLGLVQRIPGRWAFSVDPFLLSFEAKGAELELRSVFRQEVLDGYA